jgi:alpha-tubulin suppressor-like RCC1 family protein
MPNGISFNTGFKDGTQAGTDLGKCLIEKDYLISVYPQLIDNIKASSLWVWGSGIQGGLGDNTTINKSSPVQTVSAGTNWKQIGTRLNGKGASAIKTDGTLWMWGTGNQGTLGDNTSIIKSSPVQTVSSGTNWKEVSGSEYPAAIKTDGTLWTWGTGSFGRLGNNSTINRSSPVQTISAGTNWKQVSSGIGNHSAIKTDGTLWSWGTNTFGRLGDNSIIAKSSPVQTVSAGTNWKQVSVASHVAAIKTDGTLWLWGPGAGGRLGDNTTISRSSPVQTISSGTNWKQVSAGAFRVAAIKTDGTLWLWGAGYFGGLGNNGVANVSSPVQTVSSGANWKQVSSGNDTTAAIKTDGTLWLWGRGAYVGYGGILGNNSTIDRSSPVQTISAGTNWKQVSTALYTTSAIREEGDF